MRIYFIIACCILVTTFTSCSKLVEVDPPSTSLTTENVFKDSATATAAIAGIYERCMESQLNVFNGGSTMYTGLTGDELFVTSTNPQFREFYFHSLPVNNTLVQAFWQELYQMIYHSNAVLEGVQGAVSTHHWARSLRGEALFLRAFAYAELLPVFGRIPLVLTTDYRINARLANTDTAVIFQQIISDLKTAALDLSAAYPSLSGLRSRPNQSAVHALLSRIYLHQKNWMDANISANEVLKENELYELAVSPRAAFLPDSKETIWEMPAVIGGYNTGQASNFVQTEGVPTYATIQPSLILAMELNDIRFTDWIHMHEYESITYYQPYKYQWADRSQGTEHLILLRLAEIILNRAEARYQLGDIAGAIEDINMIRKRAGLSELTNLTEIETYNALKKERRIELMVESSLRFKDLKRTGELDAVMKTLKPNDWKTTAALFPIPDIEIKNNPAMEQNPGY